MKKTAKEIEKAKKTYQEYLSKQAAHMRKVRGAARDMTIDWSRCDKYRRMTPQDFRRLRESLKTLNLDDMGQLSGYVTACIDVNIPQVLKYIEQCQDEGLSVQKHLIKNRLNSAFIQSVLEAKK